MGYLAYDKERKRVRIPNEEIRAAFASAIQGTDWTPVIDAIQKSETLLESIHLNGPWWLN